jgi:hypothetical protein
MDRDWGPNGLRRPRDHMMAGNAIITLVVFKQEIPSEGPCGIGSRNTNANSTINSVLVSGVHPIGRSVVVAPGCTISDVEVPAHPVVVEYGIQRRFRARVQRLRSSHNDPRDLLVSLGGGDEPKVPAVSDPETPTLAPQLTVSWYPVFSRLVAVSSSPRVARSVM